MAHFLKKQVLLVVVGPTHFRLGKILTIRLDLRISRLQKMIVRNI